MKLHVMSAFAAISGAALISTPPTNASPYESDNFKRTSMTTLSPRLEQIFAKTKPVCFGRFIIDVPATAAVIFGRMTVDFEIAHYADGRFCQQAYRRSSINV